MLDSLGDLGGLLVDAGKVIIRGLLRGIESAFQSVKNTLSRLTAMLPSWKAPGVRAMTTLVGRQGLEP